VQQLLIPDQFHVYYGRMESDLDNRLAPSRGFDQEGDSLEFGLTWNLSEPQESQRGITRADLLWLVEELRAKEPPAAAEEAPPPTEEPPPPAEAVQEEPAPPVEVALVESAPPAEELPPPAPPEEAAPEPIAVEEVLVPPEPPPPEPIEETPLVEEPPRIESVLPAASTELPIMPAEPVAEEDDSWSEFALAATAGVAGVLAVALAAKLTPRTAAS